MFARGGTILRSPEEAENQALKSSSMDIGRRHSLRKPRNQSTRHPEAPTRFAKPVTARLPREILSRVARYLLRYFHEEASQLFH